MWIRKFCHHLKQHNSQTDVAQNVANGAVLSPSKTTQLSNCPLGPSFSPWVLSPSKTTQLSNRQYRCRKSSAVLSPSKTTQLSNSAFPACRRWRVLSPSKTTQLSNSAVVGDKKFIVLSPSKTTQLSNLKPQIERWRHNTTLCRFRGCLYFTRSHPRNQASIHIDRRRKGGYPRRGAGRICGIRSSAGRVCDSAPWRRALSALPPKSTPGR